MPNHVVARLLAEWLDNATHTHIQHQHHHHNFGNNKSDVAMLTNEILTNWEHRCLRNLADQQQQVYTCDYHFHLLIIHNHTLFAYRVATQAAAAAATIGSIFQLMYAIAGAMNIHNSSTTTQALVFVTCNGHLFFSDSLF